MAVSDALYGSTQHYVSRQRLEAMLASEFASLVERLDQTRGEHTAFFVFADTSATQTHHIGPRDIAGWASVSRRSRAASRPILFCTWRCWTLLPSASKRPSAWRA